MRVAVTCRSLIWELCGTGSARAALTDRGKGACGASATRIVHLEIAAAACLLLLSFLTQSVRAADGTQDKPRWSSRVQTVLAATAPLKFERGNRLPLYLWPASNPGDLNDEEAEYLVAELNRRGVGLISSWSPKNRERSLERALPIARAQKKLGVAVNVNASSCLNRFFNGDERTAHVDDSGKPFWDESFDVGSRKHHMGCPFALEFRKDPVREQMEFFVQAYQEADVPLDFIFVDWEIDGPIEFNRAHQASKKCLRCRQHVGDINDFRAFQKALRDIRSELQRYAFTDPVKSRFPRALIGNYAVYPHNGYRYWYDYFEYFVDGQPHVADQQAKYRLWYDDFPGTGYTCAMPVAYTWYPTYQWYDFDNADYRWFYNMLLVASNVGQHTPKSTPIISFVHWHTTAPPKDADPAVKQFSENSYQELLWHMLLRGTDTFFLWCPVKEDAEECRLVHEVYAEAQQYGEFLQKGTPVTFDVPTTPGTVVSALKLDKRLLVRRTDFGSSIEPVQLTVDSQKVSIEPKPGKTQVIRLP